jgi:hypothetical protein
MDSAGEAGGEREGHRKTVRHADDDVADGISGLEMRLVVMGCRRTGHAGSVEHVSRMDGALSMVPVAFLKERRRPAAAPQPPTAAGNTLEMQLTVFEGEIASPAWAYRVLWHSILV